jgi:hypothetical protein
MVDKQRWYSQLVLHAELRGYKKGWSYWAYKDKFGVGPDSTIFHIPATGILPEVQSWITARNIRKAKSKQQWPSKSAPFARLARAPCAWRPSSGPARAEC